MPKAMDRLSSAPCCPALGIDMYLHLLVALGNNCSGQHEHEDTCRWPGTESVADGLSDALLLCYQHLIGSKMIA
jgi:hypothetical protein